MATYSKWTARIALIVLIPVALFGLALIPLGGRGQSDVWPLSPHFGHSHFFADIEVALGYVVVGLAILVLVGVGLHHLLKRAEWLH